MATVNIKSYDNSWYQPGSAIKRVLWLLTSAFFFQHSLAIFSGLKCKILRLFGAKIGVGVVIKPSVNIKYPWFLEIGDYCWIGENVWIDNLDKTVIGNNVCISQGAMLLTGNHNYKKSTFDLMVAGITLEDGVWIGAMCVVCPGIICRSHSVLSATSVANRSLEPYGIYQGNPAVKIKDRVIQD